MATISTPQSSERGQVSTAGCLDLSQESKKEEEEEEGSLKEEGSSASSREQEWGQKGLGNGICLLSTWQPQWSCCSDSRLKILPPCHCNVELLSASSSA